MPRKTEEIIIFVLEYDDTNSVMSNVPKVCDYFFGLNKNLRVEATRVRQLSLQPHEYVIHEYGGGSFKKRVIAIYRLLQLIYRIPRERFKNIGIFHYMNHKTAIWPGILFRILGSYQVLWYAHASKPLSLRVSSRIVNQIFTSARSAFPLNSNKVLEIGQLVKVSDFPFAQMKDFQRVKGLVSVGRIAESKNLTQAIKLVAAFPKELECLTLVGPIVDTDYLEYLKTLAHRFSVKIDFVGEIPNHKLAPFLSNFGFYFNGTVGAVDKAAIEAALIGCIVLSSNENVLRLTGLDSFWEESDLKSGINIFDQLTFLMSLSDREREELRKRISKSTRERNDLEKNLGLIYANIEHSIIAKDVS